MFISYFFQASIKTFESCFAEHTVVGRQAGPITEWVEKGRLMGTKNICSKPRQQNTSSIYNSSILRNCDTFWFTATKPLFCKTAVLDKSYYYLPV